MPGKDKVRITDNWKLYIFSPYQIGKEESLTRQVVTKIVVNTKLNLAREDRNQIRRNALQNAALPKKIWSDSSLLGQLSWLQSVNPTLGMKVRQLAHVP
ncbi:MAG: hypothetical protein DMG34_15890 [Acidobacteria bacterium]|nr:MAG: hypothetical protein DMG34_15890 [Acidobacteriota bacterium]